MATKVRRLAASIMVAGERDEWVMAITCVLFDLSRGVMKGQGPGVVMLGMM